MQTPNRKDQDLRRRTLIANAFNVEPNSPFSPLRRHSVIPSPRTPHNVIEQNASQVLDGDDAERQERRRSAEVSNHISNVSPRRTSISMSETEMWNHVNSYRKLFTDNKLTARNIWSVHIIDVLQKLTNINKDTAIVVKAAPSLEVSGKVYALRVDDVHAHSIRLAGDMNRAMRDTDTDNDPPADAEDNAQHDGSMLSVARRKKAKGIRSQGMTAKNPQTLLADPIKLDTEFFSVHWDSANSVTENLFTNILPIDPMGYTFYNSPDQKFFMDQNAEDFSVSNEIKVPIAKLPDTAELRICPSFATFQMNWDPNEENARNAEDQTNQLFTNVIYDENGIPVPELDGSIQELRIDDDDNQADSCEAAPNIDATENGDVVTDLPPFDEYRSQHGATNVDRNITVLGAMRTEYSYNESLIMANGQIVDQFWAGPSHWKVKFIRSSKQRVSSNVATRNEPLRANRKRKRPNDNTDIPFDFDTWFEQAQLLPDIVNDKLPRQKKNLNLVSADKITLPEVYDYTLTQKLFLKDDTLPTNILRNKNNTTSNVEYNCANYRYDNPNDIEYCSQRDNLNDEAAPDHLDDISNAGDNILDHPAPEDEGTPVNDENYLGNMVDAPPKIEYGNVCFNTKSKKMNMKKLKSATWSSIDQLQNANEKGVCTFSEVHTHLPKLLTSAEKDELSPGLTFISVLHLAHEKGLELTQDEDINNFCIAKILQ